MVLPAVRTKELQPTPSHSYTRQGCPACSIAMAQNFPTQDTYAPEFGPVLNHPGSLLLLSWQSFYQENTQWRGWVPNSLHVRDTELWATLILTAPISPCCSLRTRPSSSYNTKGVGTCLWLAAPALSLAKSTLPVPSVQRQWHQEWKAWVPWCTSCHLPQMEQKGHRTSPHGLMWSQGH